MASDLVRSRPIPSDLIRSRPLRRACWGGWQGGRLTPWDAARTAALHPPWLHTPCDFTPLTPRAPLPYLGADDPYKLKAGLSEEEAFFIGPRAVIEPDEP